MITRSFITVWLKELKDSVRDRRTLISIFVVPTLLFPLITVAATFIASKVVHKAKTEVPLVMVLGGEDSPKTMELLKSQPKLRCRPATPDWRARVSNKEVRAVVEIPAGFDRLLEKGDVSRIQIYHYEGEMRSGFAVGELRRILSEYREKYVQDLLAKKGLQASILRPFEIQAENVAPPEKVGGNLIGGMIPYLFILVCFSSAMYPAIDLTAGEKERGTMETILCSPISRIDLALGKFLTVLTAALASILCSLVSMGASIILGGLSLSAAMGGQAAVGKAATATAGALPFSFDPFGFVGIVVLVLPLAALFSSVLLAVALYAKSVKEAQSLVTPMIVVIIIPAMMGLLPGVELNAKLALVPILNLSLACKEMLSGVWNWPLLAMIFASNLVYAGAALAFCVRQFKREDVIFRS